VLSYQIDREYLPAPKANFVRVVINGESWGIYVNVEHFNKDFVQEWFGTTKGARWKVPGSPMGQGRLAYLGEDSAPYKRIYEIKSKDDPKSWADLIRLCKVLNETPADKLEQALAPLLDIDGALKFLALDNALINNDGYWIRTSDYNIYEDVQGRFHILPQDSNETFSRPEGPGFGGGPGGGRGRRGGGPGFFVPPGVGPDSGPQGFGPGIAGGPPSAVQDGQGPDRRGAGGGGGRGFARSSIEGVKLDPLLAAHDPSKPLISKLLAVPSLRKRYLGYVRDIADKWLDWDRLGPIAEQYHGLIAADVQADTRKLESTTAFASSLTGESEATGPGRQTIPLKAFADQRRAYLLEYSEIKKLTAAAK
jgi:hypothetical protein